MSIEELQVTWRAGSPEARAASQVALSSLPGPAVPVPAGLPLLSLYLCWPEA